MTINKGPQPGRAVTRADVARYAGVSTAVVSYVINDGPKSVAPKTAARVRHAVELLGYRPNVHAQALRRGTTEMLGLVVSDPLNPFFTEFAAAIATEASLHGHALLVATAGSTADVETHLFEDLIRRQVDGLIVASVFGRPDRLLGRADRHPPTVWIDAPGPISGYSSVRVDGYEAARIGVDHLVTVHGHTRIGLVVGGIGGAGADPRERGWQLALVDAGLSPGPLVRVSWTREGGYEGGRRLLGLADRPTAIFASSDLQAVGLLRAAHESRIELPADLAVVAFDGTKESEFSWPPLTVVAQPIEQMAKAAVRLVLDRSGTTAYEQFTGKLVVRQSCGCVG